MHRELGLNCVLLSTVVASDVGALLVLVLELDHLLFEDLGLGEVDWRCGHVGCSAHGGAENWRTLMTIVQGGAASCGIATVAEEVLGGVAVFSHSDSTHSYRAL